MSVLPPIGSTIVLPDGGGAKLRFVGSIDNKEGVFCGLELLGALSSKGKNSGWVGPKQYFQVEVEGSGLFVPLRKVQSWFPQQQPQHEFKTPNQNFSPRIAQSGMNSSAPLVRMDSGLENELDEMFSQVELLQQALEHQKGESINKDQIFTKYKQESLEEITQLTNTIKFLNDKINQYEQSVAPVQSNGETVDRLKNENTQLVAKVNELENELRSFKTEFDRFKVAKAEEINVLREFEMQNYSLNMKLEEKDEEIAALRKKLESVSHQNDNTMSEGVSATTHNASNSRPTSNTNLINSDGTLRIFTPSHKIREENYCSYCDKKGHTDEECVYQNDDDDDLNLQF